VVYYAAEPAFNTQKDTVYTSLNGAGVDRLAAGQSSGSAASMSIQALPGRSILRAKIGAALRISSPCSSAYRLHAAAEDPIPSSGGPVVVFIHGWQMERPDCASWSNFDPSQNGREVFRHLNDHTEFASRADYWRYTYPTFNSLDDAALDLATHLRNQFMGRSDVVLVGHSMGGLVARRAAQLLNGGSVQIARVITLGTPHRGSEAASPGFFAPVSWLSAWAISTAGSRDLRPGSAFLNRLNSAAEDETRTYSFAGSLERGLLPCGHGLTLCAGFATTYTLFLGGHGLQSDAVVPISSARLYEPTATTAIGYDHTEMSRGNYGKNGFNSPDSLLVTVAQRIVEAFAPAQGSIIGLGTLGGEMSRAQDVNDRAEVAGTSSTAHNQSRAFYWSQEAKMINLGTLGGTSSFAAAINNKGQVVGTSAHPSSFFHAFIWERSTGMRDIGAPSGCSSEARDINDAGVVVGFTTCSGIKRAFRWTSDTGRIDLGAPSSEWQQTRAVGINEHGDVAMLLSRCFSCSDFNYLRTAAGEWSVMPGYFGRSLRVDAINGSRTFVGGVNNGFYGFGARWTMEPNSMIGCHLGLSSLGSTAEDLNEAGDFVGTAVDPQTNAVRALLCTGKGIPAAHALAPVAGFSDSWAYGINDGGSVTYVVGESSSTTNRARARATLWAVR
ncbi:MAG TPA: alpha/beta fold hydrolase, partial [Longimicrobiaceae bacterium]|nr:alpha/beta fold hydrolase [Longimicrobiaceae bacterium]